MNALDLSSYTDLEQLRSLIGQRVRYAGEPYRITDVLPEGPSLVLEHRSHDRIQDDLQGRAYRRVPETFDLRLLDDAGHLSELLELLELEAPENR
jgi:trehalose utilization protein